MVQPLTNIQYKNLFKLFNNGHGSINYRFNYHQCGNSHQQYTKAKSILKNILIISFRATL